MVVTNQTKLDAYANISAAAYDPLAGTPNVPGSSGQYVQIFRSIDQVSNGFQARAFFNTSENELVIGFAGTEGFRNRDFAEFLPDLAAGLLLAVSGAPGSQLDTGIYFIDQAIDEAERLGYSNFDVTYTGHSLGGFLAQAVSAESPDAPEGEVVAFNAPGAGGFTTIPTANAFPSDRYTYIYSDPDQWGLVGGAIHSIGERLSSNVSYVPGATGHALEAADGKGLSQQLDAQTNLMSVQSSDFTDINQALLLTGLTGLLSFIDGGIDEETGGADTIVGTAGNDAVDGMNGNDDISGLAGDDLLMGSGGNDLIRGDGGADTVSGGAGADTLIGGTEADLILGSDGDDRLFGNAGDDFIFGGAGDDRLFGGAGNDILTANGGQDTLYGDAGNDYLNGGFAADELTGGSGADRFYHSGDANHISKWVNDYDAGEGDILIFNDIPGANINSLTVNVATTNGRGSNGEAEVFIGYQGTSQTLWAVTDGAGMNEINLRFEGDNTVYDMLDFI